MQRMILINSPFFFSEERIKSVSDWAREFGNDQPLSLEIGCGTGHFIVELARRNPQRNYLAIDIFNRGCDKTCRKLHDEGLSNVRVARAEARQFLSQHLAPGSLSEIFINCPDPWPKKRHRRRRLVNAEFLPLLRYALRPEGALYFASDVQDYAQDVAALLDDTTCFARAREAAVVEELPDYPRSKYMERFLERGEPIYFVHFRRRPQAAAQVEPPRVQPGFRLHWCAGGP
ncbi:tRNA (guanosine(46)-N7)-methyltransferase TrmB [Geoalkalibacter halelectricus]|uniref:tRNA (guanosine(46)-N7)-methyltransferase TrmB n=1 Tax=Geoalkalibacter halelectricus TaxID=2847045 RepID=UPI003D226B91